MNAVAGASLPRPPLFIFWRGPNYNVGVMLVSGAADLGERRLANRHQTKTPSSRRRTKERLDRIGEETRTRLRGVAAKGRTTGFFWRIRFGWNQIGRRARTPSDRVAPKRTQRSLPLTRTHGNQPIETLDSPDNSEIQMLACQCNWARKLILVSRNAPNAG